MMRCDTLSELRELLEKQGIGIEDCDLEALLEALPHVWRMCERLSAFGQQETVEYSHLFSVLNVNLTVDRSLNANTNDY
ncbi:hypothetical protein OKW39_008913 [Paraburkholderia sp. MM6662-R1]